MTTYVQFTKQTTVESIKRLNNSRNGNPRYSIRFTNGPFEGVTKTDAGFAYTIHNGLVMKPVIVKFHYTTRYPWCIIDDIEEIKESE